MKALKLKKEQYLRRRKRSKKAFANKDEMRLCIFKSTNHIEAQIIDDFNQKTIVSASSKEKEFSKKKVTKTELAALVGTSLSKRVKGKKINKIYFDRNGFRYHGRVKSLADAAREGGLKF